jgi:hypothetical protein
VGRRDDARVRVEIPLNVQGSIGQEAIRTLGGAKVQMFKRLFEHRERLNVNVQEGLDHHYLQCGCQ